ncbi:hypothetical protein B0H34DRAFT_717252 [Crassisporium funariophilum]|nr:hypothetical protein B0H34DRAFT_717252 [Crassisporium funariophilum]
MASGSTPLATSSQAVDMASATNISEYPVQRHAGKVGLGPNYHVAGDVVSPSIGIAPSSMNSDCQQTITERLSSFAHGMAGKFTHNPDHGHESVSNESSRKELPREKTDPKDQMFDSGNAKKANVLAPPSPPSARKSLEVQPAKIPSPGNKFVREAAPLTTNSTHPIPLKGREAVSHINHG